MATREANEALVRRYFQAIGAGDLDAVIAMMDPELIFRCAGGRGAAEPVVFRGPLALRTDLEHSSGDLYDGDVGMQAEILHLLAEEGERVAAEVRIRGRSARTGEVYDNLYAFFFWIRDGRIREVHEHLDTAYVNRILLEPAGIQAGADMPWLESEAGRGTRGT